MDLAAFVDAFFPALLSGAYLAGALAASVHILIQKRHTRAAIGWLGLVWFSPLLGALFYLFFGVNRLHRKAVSLRHGPDALSEREHEVCATTVDDDPRVAHLADFVPIMDSLTANPLLDGNDIRMLEGGDEAYMSMLKSIEEAEQTILMVSYIFDRGKVADVFGEKLLEAQERGVEVKVLVDAVGARYSFPAADWTLRRRGLNIRRFLPGFLSPWFNLRNHRKLLIVDGMVGYTGGLNIRDEHLAERGEEMTFDTHFELRGPIVAQLTTCFCEDWAFATKEILEGPRYFPGIAPHGSMLARGFPDGPDARIATLFWGLLGIIACARERVQIVTPYFLPELELATALDVAAMRGVQVDLVIPRMSNLPFVSWATWGHLRHVLGRGVNVYASPKPFDHSKLMVVDGRWALVGSSNWDSRSLRLNFEFNVEVYDEGLAQQISESIDARIERSTRVTMEELHERPLPIRLRDGLARLFSPYL